MYSEPIKNSRDVNECTSRGICSTSPILSALQELIMLFIEHSSYYILKLKALGVCNVPLLQSVTEDIASLISINEFTDKQLYEIVLKDYSILMSLKNMYSNISLKSGKKAVLLDLPINFDKKTTLTKSISLGEKVFLLKYNRNSHEVRNIVEILISEVKCLSYNILKLNEYSIFDINGIYLVLKSLNMLNNSGLNYDKLSSQITKLAKYDYKVKVEIADMMFKTFGEISAKTVSLSTRSGNAILVSGNNFFDLKEILELTKDKNIDVYTHSNLLVAHSLESFQKYKNLVGHFGLTENNIVDFASFPGSILLAGTHKNSSDYLYRGRIFSRDYIIHSGITPIINDDYSPLISSSLSAKGFKKNNQRGEILLGFDKEVIFPKLRELSKKLKSGEISHLYIIGINSYSEIQKNYFNQFFGLLNDDEFVITFSHTSTRKNILNINVANFIPLVTYILSEFIKNYTLDEKITFILTTCDVMTISSLVMLKAMEAQSIYMCPCPPYIMNPSVFELLKDKFGVKETSSPKQDIARIRNIKK